MFNVWGAVAAEMASALDRVTVSKQYSATDVFVRSKILKDPEDIIPPSVLMEKVYKNSDKVLRAIDDIGVYRIPVDHAAIVNKHANKRKGLMCLVGLSVVVEMVAVFGWLYFVIPGLLASIMLGASVMGMMGCGIGFVQYNWRSDYVQALKLQLYKEQFALSDLDKLYDIKSQQWDDMDVLAVLDAQIHKKENEAIVVDPVIQWNAPPPALKRFLK